MIYVANVNTISNKKIRYLFGTEAYELKPAEEKPVHHTKARLSFQELKSLEKREKRARLLSFVLSVVIIIFFSVLAVHMSTVVTIKQAKASALNQTLVNKSAENNAIEYEIERSINIAFIIDEATRYGMVRAEHSQIHEFKSDNYEYIEILRDLP